MRRPSPATDSVARVVAQRPTIVEHLAGFAARTEFADLPDRVRDEAKRLVLDSVGCALAAVGSPKARIGIDYGRISGRGSDEATILGTAHRASVLGAAFANGELISALDFDAVLAPGHVVPYVLPGALALAERDRRSGGELITAVAVAHEMTYRIGKAMDYVRDVQDGRMVHPAVFGYSSSLFGATAAIGRLLGLAEGTQVDALGIAACIAPVNSMWSAAQRSHPSTIKFLPAGVVAQTAFTAAHMAAGGHRGDREVLDDRDFGYPRFIGTSRWEPEHILDELGDDWRFPSEQAYKFYPHCRVPAALLDALDELVEVHDIMPSEIESIEAFVEPQGLLPMWTNRDIEHVGDAQFSLAHGFAVAAHRVRPRRRWQDPDVVFDPSVLALAEKVTLAPHPEYEQRLSADPASRLSMLKLTARGMSHVVERAYPKGGPSPDPTTYATTDELVAKFIDNAEPVLSQDVIERFVAGVLDLDEVDDVRDLIRLCSSTGAA